MLRLKDGFTGERSIVLPQMIIDIESQDALTSSLYITDIGFYPHAAHHFRERKEPISQHVLLYCVEGEGWYKVKDKTHKLKANQYCVLPAHEPHAYGTSETAPWTLYWVHFCGPHGDVYAQGADLPQDIVSSVNSRISERNNVFDAIMHTLEQGYGLEHLRYASSMLHYYLASMRYLNIYREGGNAETNMVSGAIHYMQEHLEKRLQLQEIAKFTGYSASHLSAVFRQQTGLSPINYFNQLKVQRACQLLISTSLRINQISMAVGINDSYYFSRLFTRQMGLSPKDYRLKQQRGK